MIGRERERDVVRSSVARAGNGGSAFLLVVGEPGIGKTTLLRELSDLATNAGRARRSRAAVAVDVGVGDHFQPARGTGAGRRTESLRGL